MRCPICGKPSEARYRPFCSRRCADVDLGGWLGGHYRVPAESPEDLDDAAAELEAEAERRKPH